MDVAIKELEDFVVGLGSEVTGPEDLRAEMKRPRKRKGEGGTVLYAGAAAKSLDMQLILRCVFRCMRNSWRNS